MFSLAGVVSHLICTTQISEEQPNDWSQEPLLLEVSGCSPMSKFRAEVPIKITIVSAWDLSRLLASYSSEMSGIGQPLFWNSGLHAWHAFPVEMHATSFFEHSGTQRTETDNLSIRHIDCPIV